LHTGPLLLHVFNKRPRSLHIAGGLQTYKILKFVVCPFGMDSVLMMKGKCCGKYVLKIWGGGADRLATPLEVLISKAVGEG